MLRRILFVLLCFICCSNLSAQIFGFGVKGGANFIRFSDGMNSPRTYITPHYGTITYFGIYKRLGLQFEALYSSMKGQFDFDSIKLDVKFKYLVFPITLRYRLSSNFFASLGPQINLMTSQAVQGERITISRPETEMFITAGIAYRHSSGFGIETRYLRALSQQYTTTTTGRRLGFNPNMFQLTLFCLGLFDDE